MNDMEYNSYLISSSITCENHDELRGISLYANDNIPVILQKIGFVNSKEETHVGQK